MIRNFDDLLELAHIDFGPIYERIEALPEYQPAHVLDSDVVLTRGTGLYHQPSSKP